MAFVPLQPGQLFARQYRVVRQLGEGGMGVLYLVEQVSTGAPRALKLIRDELLADARIKARFAQEARVGASIASDHVVQVLDAGIDPDQGRPFIVMELLEGESLQQALERRQFFGPQEIAEIFRQLCHALSAAHAVGVVHRDIKPENIFLTRGRFAGVAFMLKVLDFGIAKVLADSRASGATQAIGTPLWMAPEQMSSNATITPRADIWPLGLIAFQLLTGYSYWTAHGQTGTMALLREICVEPIVPASVRAAQYGVGGRLPPGFDPVFARCVDREPQNRFETVDELYEALITALNPASLPPQDVLGGLAAASAPLGRPTPVAPTRRQTNPPGQQLNTLLATEGAPAFAASGSTSGPPQYYPGASAPPPPHFSGVPARPASAGVPRRSVGLWLGTAGALLGLLALGGYKLATSSAKPTVAPDGVAVPTVLRLHGSSTIGAELAPALVEAYLLSKKATSIHRREPAKPATVEIEAVLPGQGAPSAFEVVGLGSKTAFEDLGTGSCDIGMASRPINAAEAGSLKRFGDMTAAASEHIIALDGIAVIVNPENPVQSLTLGQLKRMFTGSIQDWGSLPNGERGPIALLARNEKSGTFETFKGLVLGSDPLSPAVKPLEDSEELVSAVASDRNAIGFVGLPNLKPSVKVLSIAQREGGQARLPNALTIRTEDYALGRRLFLYVPEKPTAPPGLIGGMPLPADFVEFAESPDGQKVVEKTGAVGMFVNEEPASNGKCEGCPEEYQRATQGAHRLTVNLRFERNSDQLETFAQSNIKRLVTTFKESGDTRKLSLFGFTDSKGQADANQALSVDRAKSVADVLQQNGLPVGEIEGFGAQMPIADNVDDDGRYKNRRVEVWIR